MNNNTIQHTMDNKILCRLAMAVVAGSLALCGCTEKNTNPEGGTYTGKELKLIAEQSQGKTTVDNLKVYWVSGDRVLINGTAYPVATSSDGLQAEIDFDNSETAILALFPASLGSASSAEATSIDVQLPAEYDYVEVDGRQRLDLPMVGKAAAGAEGVQLKHLCGAMDVCVTNNSSSLMYLDSVVIFSGNQLCGTLTGLDISDMTHFALDAIDADATADNGRVTVRFAHEEYPLAANGGVKTVQVPVLPCQDMTVKVCLHKVVPGVIVIPRIVYQRTAGGKTLGRAQVMRANVNLGAANPASGAYLSSPNGFTVGEGKCVHLSQGNLQYICSAATPYWKFADNQWEYLGTTTGQNSDAANVNRDLFGWGTSGWNSGATYYQPYSCGTSNTGYFPGGSVDNDLTGAYAEADWAWHNAISNGGNAAHQWRTLTRSEWQYILFTRNTTTNLGTRDAHYAKCKVNNVKGLVLFPDVYIHPTGIAVPININNSQVGWPDDNNSYTVAQWAEMEAAGAIFLPAAGRRSYRDVERANEEGSYWSSMHSTDISEPAAYCVYFTATSMLPKSSKYRFYGQSVRPVHDAW